MSKTSIKVELTAPVGLRMAFARLKDAAGNRVVRKALEAAKRPPRRYLRKVTRELRDNSDQSTGATHRAIDAKAVFPSKTKAGYGYMIAGVDMAHYEIHSKNTKRSMAAFQAARSGKGKSQRRDRNVGYIQRQRRSTRRNLTKPLVRSYQKTPLRKRKGARHQKNIPGKIWHLLEDGFQHYRGVRFTGYRFTAQAESQTLQESVAAFERVLGEGLKRELGRT